MVHNGRAICHVRGPLACQLVVRFGRSDLIARFAVVLPLTYVSAHDKRARDGVQDDNGDYAVHEDHVCQGHFPVRQWCARHACTYRWRRLVAKAQIMVVPPKTQHRPRKVSITAISRDQQFDDRAALVALGVDRALGFDFIDRPFVTRVQLTDGLGV